jgi:hypothetical protein
MMWDKDGRIQDFKLGVGGGAHLKKNAPSGGRRENCWGISCEKSRFYAKNAYFFRRVPPPWIRPWKSRNFLWKSNLNEIMQQLYAYFWKPLSHILAIYITVFHVWPVIYIYKIICNRSTVVKELRSKMFGQHPGYSKAVFLKKTRIIIVSIYEYTVYIMFWIMMLYDFYYY